MNRAKRGQWIVWVNAAVVRGEAEVTLDTRSITTTTAVNIINVDNDDDAAEGEGVYNSGGGGNIDYIDGGGGGNDDDITSFFLSLWKFSNFGHFAATFRGATYDLAGSIGKRSIYGLDTTTNR